MLTCINKNSSEYQTLKDRSGISDFILEAVCRDYLNKYDRYPYLDELPNSNSEQHLRQQLHINNMNGTKIETILNSTGKSTIQEANADINNQYRDLEVDITPINKEAIVDIRHRPSVNSFNELDIKVDQNPSNYLVFNQIIDKLSKLYGIRFNSITDAELNTDQWKGLIQDVGAVNAFIYNGEIYINLDRNSVDSPIHEIMHMLVGSIRFSDPRTYQKLVDSVQSFPNYNSLIKEYQGRSRNDANEELLVTEISRYLTGMPSNINQLNDNLKHEILYNVQRTLDTILMGQDSVKTLTNDRLLNLSIKELSKEVKSTLLENNFTGTLNVENSELHRKLNNIKADLIKQKLLEEQCN